MRKPVVISEWEIGSKYGSAASFHLYRPVMSVGVSAYVLCSFVFDVLLVKRLTTIAMVRQAFANIADGLLGERCTQQRFICVSMSQGIAIRTGYAALACILKTVFDTTVVCVSQIHLVLGSAYPSNMGGDKVPGMHQCGWYQDQVSA